jgi:alpha-L-fucosidase
VGANGGPASPGDVRARESPTGTRNGGKWLPAECDVSIRPGWFWHESENARVKTVQQLITLYYQSTGRGANFLLNVPPTTAGLLGEPDIASLRAFGAYRRATFGKNLLLNAKAEASDTRSRAFGAKNLVDGRADTCWAAGDSIRTAGITVEPGRPITFSVIRIREAIQFGQRIDAVAVDRWDSGAWQEIAAATSIGGRRLIRLERPFVATRLRLRVTQASASPALSEFAVFAEPR